jgi:hypothetical protein
MMMSPTGVDDDDLDSFLTYLNTPTTKNVQRKKMKSVNKLDDFLALPYASEKMNDDRDDAATTTTTTSATTKSDNEFDDFLSYLGGGGEEGISMERGDDDSVDEEFLAYLGGGGSTAVVASSKPTVTSTDSVDEFVAYLNGGDVPPATTTPNRHVEDSASPSPDRRGQREKSARPVAVATANESSPLSTKKAKIDRHNLPIDYFVTLNRMEIEARNRAMRELSESVRPIAITYFTNLGESEARKNRATMKALSDESMPVATRHFNELAEMKRRTSSTSSSGDVVEPMPSAIAYFTLAEREANMARRAVIADMKANPPPMPAGQEYFTMKDRELRAAKAAAIRELIDNPPPTSIAQEHFTKLAEERKVKLQLEASEPLPPAIEYFTTKAKEDKAKREQALRELRENPEQASVATQHFNERASRMAEERKVRRVSVGDVVPLEPVPIDYFVNLYKEEAEAKARESRELAESIMPTATRHFTELGRTKSQGSFVLDVEAMPIATRHFHEVEAEKRAASKASEEHREVETMPMAIQRFTQAAREEKLKRASISVELEPIPIAHVHFTPSLRDRMQVASE